MLYFYLFVEEKNVTLIGEFQSFENWSQKS